MHSLALLALLASSCVAADEPKYHGQALSFWLDELEKPGDGREKQRWVAASVLAELGPGDRAALPVVLERLKNRELGPHSPELFVLRRVGPAAVDALAAMLKETDADGLIGALRALAELAPHGRCALGGVRRLLADKRPAVRLAACRAELALGDDPADVVPVCVALLKSNKAGIMADAARLLGLVGSAARSAYDDLKPLLKDANPAVARAAAVALARIDPTRKEPVAVLIAWLRTYEPQTSAQPEVADALDALRRLGDCAVPGLVGIVRASKPATDAAGKCQVPDFSGQQPEPDGPGLQAARLLAASGRSSPAAAAALATMLGARDDDDVFRDCLLALGEVAVEPLLAGLASGKDGRRARAVGTLARLGHVARPALLKATRDRSAGARADAAFMLGRQGVVTPEVEKELRRLLGDDDEAVRLAAALALCRLDPVFWPEAQTMAVRALASRVAVTRRAAADLLANTGARDKEAVAALGKALADEDDAVRCVAAWSLMEMGPAAAPQAAALKRALKDADGAVARWAALALCRLDPSAGDALPVLVANGERSALTYGERARPFLLDRLQQLLNPKDPEKRDLIAAFELSRMIGELGPGNAATVAALKAALHEFPTHERIDVALSLVKAEPTNKDHQRMVIGLLLDTQRGDELPDTAIEWDREFVPDLLRTFPRVEGKGRRMQHGLREMRDELPVRYWLFLQIARAAGLEVPGDGPQRPRPTAEIKDVLPTLLADMTRWKSHRRADVLEMWGHNLHGPQRKALLAALEQALDKADPEMRLRIAEVLLLDAEHRGRACELLNEGLGHKEVAVRHLALGVLQRRDLLGGPFDRSLQILFDDPDSGIREWAVRLLSTQEDVSTDLLRRLVEQRRKDEAATVGYWATEALGRLDSAGDVSGRDLETDLFQQEWNLRCAAMREQRGPDPTPRALAEQQRVLDSLVPQLVKLVLIYSLLPECDGLGHNLDPLFRRVTPAALPALEEAFCGDTGRGPARSLSDPALQEAVARWFACLGAPGKRAAPLLRQALHSRHPAVREEALRALAVLDPTPDEMAPYLGCVLRDSITPNPRHPDSPDEELLRRAVADGKPLVPGLVKLLRDRSLDLPLPPRPLQVMSLDDDSGPWLPHPPGRAFVSVLLGCVGKDARAAAPALLAALKDDNVGVRTWAAWALLRIDENVGAALAVALEQVQGTVDGAERALLIQAVGGHPEHTRDIMPVLLRVLRRYAAGATALTPWMQSPEGEARSALLSVLGEFGAAAKEAAPLLHTLAKSPPASITDPSERLALRWEAAAALARVTGDTVPAVVVLKEAAKADVWPLRLHQTIAAVGLKREELAPLLKPALRSKEATGRVTGFGALLRCEALSVKELEAALQELLDRGDPVEEFADLGRRLRPLVPVLKKAREATVFDRQRADIDVLLRHAGE